MKKKLFLFTEFSACFIAIVSVLWNILLSPSNKEYIKPMDANNGECEIEGKYLYFKYSLTNSFWQYYFKGSRGIVVDYEILYEDMYGFHTLLSYKNRFGEGAAIKFIDENSENITIFYSNPSAIVFYKNNNPFSKDLLIESNVSKFFERNHKTVCFIP